MERGKGCSPTMKQVLLEKKYALLDTALDRRLLRLVLRSRPFPPAEGLGGGIGRLLKSQLFVLEGGNTFHPTHLGFEERGWLGGKMEKGFCREG